MTAHTMTCNPEVSLRISSLCLSCTTALCQTIMNVPANTNNLFASFSKIILFFKLSSTCNNFLLKNWDENLEFRVQFICYFVIIASLFCLLVL